MPITEIERTEIYNVQTGEITIEEREIEVKTNEELVTEKQDELLKVYAELQILLEVQNNG
jgi:hypothetical protein